MAISRQFLLDLGTSWFNQLKKNLNLSSWKTLITNPLSPEGNIELGRIYHHIMMNGKVLRPSDHLLDEFLVRFDPRAHIMGAIADTLVDAKVDSEAAKSSPSIEYLAHLYSSEKTKTYAALNLMPNERKGKTDDTIKRNNIWNAMTELFTAYTDAYQFRNCTTPSYPNQQELTSAKIHIAVIADVILKNIIITDDITLAQDLLISINTWNALDKGLASTLPRHYLTNGAMLNMQLIPRIFNYMIAYSKMLASTENEKRMRHFELFFRNGVSSINQDKALHLKGIEDLSIAAKDIKLTPFTRIKR